MMNILSHVLIQLIAIMTLSQAHSAVEKCLALGILGEFHRPSAKTAFPFGEDIKRGVLTAQTIYNTQCFNVEYLDFNSSISNIPDVIRRATKKGVRFFVGLGLSDQVLVANPVLAETKSLLITPTASSDEINSSESRAIMMFPRNSFIAAQISKKLREQNINILGIISANNNAYSRNITKHFKERFLSQGGQIAFAYQTRNGELNAEQIRSISASNIKHIFLPLFELDVAKTVTALSSQVNKISYIGTDSWGTSSTVIKRLTVNVSFEAVLPLVYSPDLQVSENRTFVRSFRRKFRSEPNDLSAFSFDAYGLLTKMVAKCGQDKLLESPSTCLQQTLPISSVTGSLESAKHLALDRPLAFRYFRNTK